MAWIYLAESADSALPLANGLDQSKLSVEQWVDAVKRVSESDFCNGSTANGDWKASFDWLIGHDKNKTPNYVKVMEGNYDNRRVKPRKDEWTESALKVLQAIKIPAGDDRAKFLGEELLKRVRAIGGMSVVGQMQSNDFTVRKLAGLLMSAQVEGA